MEKKIEMASTVAGFLVALGVSTLVGGAVALTKPKNLNLFKEVSVGLAGLTLSSMATEEVGAYLEKKLEPIKDAAKKFFKVQPEETLKKEEAI